MLQFVEERPDGSFPVYKGESFDTWRPDLGITSYYGWGDPSVIEPSLQARRLRGSATAAIDVETLRDPATLPDRFARIAFRDMTRATDTRTVRAALVPPNVFIVHLAPYVLWIRGDESDQAFLIGVLSSTALDWFARRWVETHLTYNFFNPLPIPRPPRSAPLWQRAVALSGRLAAPDDRFADWAAAVGVDHGPLPAEEKQDMIDELDAVVAHLYGLSSDQLTHIFETFHEGWDFQPRLTAVLAHFARLAV